MSKRHDNTIEKSSFFTLVISSNDFRCGVWSENKLITVDKMGRKFGCMRGLCDEPNSKSLKVSCVRWHLDGIPALGVHDVTVGIPSEIDRKSNWSHIKESINLLLARWLAFYASISSPTAGLLSLSERLCSLQFGQRCGPIECLASNICMHFLLAVDIAERCSWNLWATKANKRKNKAINWNCDCIH